MSHNNFSNRNKHGAVIIGMILIAIGIFLFIRAILPGFPFFNISWQMILIIVGILIGIKTRFRSPVPYILIIFGVLSYINHNIYHIPFYRALFLPIIVIGIGILIIQKDKKKRQFIENMINPQDNPSMTPVTYDFQQKHSNFHSDNVNTDENVQNSPDDYINIHSILSGNNTVVFSKNLKSADINCIFGGANINLRQADFKNVVVVDILTICGGVEFKIPSNWKIKNELVAVFGGVSDERNLFNITPDENKTIILRGTVVMGGIEIKN